MSATFLRYFSILLFTFGLTIAAHTVLAADDPSTRGLSESTRLLFKAINENNIESARTAVGQGANINAENSLGVRPVDLAVDLGYFDLAHFLLSANRAPEKKEDDIALPPPMIPIPAQGDTRSDLPPILSGPQVSVPAVSSAPLPAITAPQITAPKISAPRISAPKFAAPRISAPKIVAPAPPPIVAPPIISAPRIPSQPRITAPRISAPNIVAPTPSTPRISAPQFRAPTLPVAPTRAENLPVEKTVPIPPKISKMQSTKPGSVSNLDIIAPPEPPPLTTEDGTVVQTPTPLKQKETTTRITSPPVQATTSPSDGSQSGDEGFMSNVWNSMTGWLPFGGDSDESVAPRKQNKPIAPLTPTVKESSKEAEKGFLSNTWDSMTDWSPSSDDSKKNNEIKVKPPAPRLPLSPAAPSTSLLAPNVSKQPSLASGDIQKEPVPAITLTKRNDNEAPTPTPVSRPQQGDQKVRQEKAMLAAKQRAEAELLPQLATNLIQPEPKKKVSIPTKTVSLAAQSPLQPVKVISAPAPPVAKPPIEVAKFEDSPRKVEASEKAKEVIPTVLNKVDKNSPESVVEPKPPADPPLEKKGIFAKLGEFFTSRRDVESEDSDIIAEQPAKIDVTPKESFSEISKSKNSSSYANLPLPEPPPITKTISIPKSIKLVVGTKSRLGKDLDVDLVEDSKCVEKTRHNTLFCLERVSWPPDIRKNLKSPLSLMGDNMAMVRYDGGKASQIHLNFPTDAFDMLVEYFETKYGPPTEYPKILMHRIGVPPKENPTVLWRVANPEMKRDVILEIRKTDDLRSILPAEGTGVARLYSSGDGMMFRYVSTADIMLMRMKYSTTRRRKRTN